jgi:hypothetical protein
LGYWLVVVGNLGSKPSARVFRDPHRPLIDVKCVWRRSVTASWTSRVSLS